jgi:two-component system response regulator FixJ
MTAASGNPIVLIVDDDPAVRDSLSALLQAAGLQARTFETGRDLLKACGSVGRGCILLDVCLPDQDGFQVFHALKDAAVRLPVIFITAHETQAEKARTAIKGAFAVLEKPIREDILMATIAGAMEAGWHGQERGGGGGDVHCASATSGRTRAASPE